MSWIKSQIENSLNAIAVTCCVIMLCLLTVDSTDASVYQHSVYYFLQLPKSSTFSIQIKLLPLKFDSKQGWKRDESVYSTYFNSVYYALHKFIRQLIQSLRDKLSIIYGRVRWIPVCILEKYQYTAHRDSYLIWEEQRGQEQRGQVSY